MKPFLTHQSWKSLYCGNQIQRLLGIVNGFMSRIGHVVGASRYDLVFIHRELSPLGPPIFEWLIAKVLRKKIIYDFDDAIWLPDPNETNKLWQILKWKSKVKWICRWSWKVSAGNEYLADFARQFCDQVEVIPTVVDTNIHRPADDRSFAGAPSASKSLPAAKLNDGGEGDPGINPGITIGWTGSHTTLQYLHPLLPLLKELDDRYNIHFLVIANKDPQFDLRNYRFVKWSREREVEDLQAMDIGIMPLTDDLWSRGKCGFKAIQYSAAGIPAVVSAVGVNSKVVIHGKTGFVCRREEDWRQYLMQLIESQELRTELGENGREHIRKHYSVDSTKDKFLGLFQE